MWAGMLDLRKLIAHLLWGVDAGFANAGATDLSKTRGHEGEGHAGHAPRLETASRSALRISYQTPQHARQGVEW